MRQMEKAIEVFRASADRVRNLGGLHGAISALTTPVIDSSDLLRAQIVLTVSALDHFIHEVTVLGMVETFNGARPPTAAFNRQKVSGHLLISAPSGRGVLFEEDVRQRHALLSFQQPDKIADAIRLISEASLWKEVALKVGVSEEALKTKLRLIVERRNKIAHEADIDPSYPGARWPIKPQDAEDALQFIVSLCEAIFDLVRL